MVHFAIGSFLATVLLLQTQAQILVQDPSERTFFYGPTSTHLGQWVSFLRLKSAVKAKAYDCKRIHYCAKGAIKSLFLPSKPALKDLMRFLAENHQGILGAIASGYLRKDCEKLYPKCFMKIRVVTSDVPCLPGETCFRLMAPAVEADLSSEETSSSETAQDPDADVIVSTEVSVRENGISSNITEKIEIVL